MNTTATPPKVADLAASWAEMDRLARVEACWLDIQQATRQELAVLDTTERELALRLRSELATIDRLLIQTRETRRILLQTIWQWEANHCYAAASRLLHAAERLEQSGQASGVASSPGRLRRTAARYQVEAAAWETRVARLVGAPLGTLPDDLLPAPADA